MFLLCLRCTAWWVWEQRLEACAGVCAAQRGKMMHDKLLIMSIVGALGFGTGLMTFYLLLKYKAVVPTRQAAHLILELPCLGRIQTRFRLRYTGLFLDDWEECHEKVARLSQFVPHEVLFHYARTFGIDYIGLEGDRRDGTWNPRRLASLGRGTRGEQQLCLNPDLDTVDVAYHLSRELGEVIRPSEVYLFLFLHEIGHTPQAGNQCYVTAMIRHVLAGGRRSPRRRQELWRLKRQIEQHADQFALRELHRWRVQQGQGELVQPLQT
jgi:hypothetical protein